MGGENMSNPEENKVNAQVFYDLMFNQCKPDEAIAVMTATLMTLIGRDIKH